MGRSSGHASRKGRRRSRIFGLPLFGGALALALFVLAADLGASYLTPESPPPPASGVHVVASGLRIDPEASTSRALRPAPRVAGLSPDSFQDILTLSALGAIVLGLRRL